MGPIPCIPFRNQSIQHKDDFMANNEIFTENRNENFRIKSHMFFTATLEDLKNVLYVALNPYFEEFEIAVVSCPCLTREPYNLAAAGLSGNTGILQIGFFENFRPRPRTNYAYNIYEILSRCNYNAFVIGSGFAAKPIMPYNGHLTMNAVVSTNDRNIINNSCIAYQHTRTGQKRFKIINDPNQIKCSLFGQFFFSGGKRGPVIKMRAKGRRSRSSIIALIQKALTNLCQYKPIIGLGIVLVLNGGQTVQHHLPNNFLEVVYNDIMDYCHKLRADPSNCVNLIALGAVISEDLLAFINQDDRTFLLNGTSMFNAFHNFKYMGSFFYDLTPEETEYIVYINIAQEICL
ncbi:hypothetical protein ACFW04_005128 [Cataglyphis niger]